MSSLYVYIYIHIYIYNSPYAFQTVGARINWLVVLAMTVGYFTYFFWTPSSRRCLRCYKCKYKTFGEPISTIALDDLTFTGTQVHYNDNVCTTAVWYCMFGEHTFGYFWQTRISRLCTTKSGYFQLNISIAFDWIVLHFPVVQFQRHLSVSFAVHHHWLV